MTLVDLFFLIALVVDIVELAQSRGRSLVGWALLFVIVGLLIAAHGLQT